MMPSYRVPGLTWLFLLIAIAIYELWATKTDNYTLSQWVWLQDVNHPWFKWIVLGGVGVLMFHFFWQRGWK